MIYYQEYLGFNALKGCMFALGVLVSPSPFDSPLPTRHCQAVVVKI